MTQTLLARRPLRSPGKTSPKTRPGGIAPLRGLLPIVVALGVWQLVGSPDSFTYPPPSEWWESLKEMNAEGLLLPALGETLTTFGTGLLLATLLGMCLGAFAGSSARSERALGPLMDFFRALPPPAVITVLLLMLGPDYSTVILMVVLGGIWPVLLNTATGMRSIPPVRLEASRGLGLTRRNHIRSVILPSLIPSVVLGVKVAASIAFVVTLFIEVLGITDGLGFLMVSRQQVYDSAGTWGVLFVVGVCGYLINVIVSVLGRVLLRGWPQAGGA